jgi:hypothetical protein
MFATSKSPTSFDSWTDISSEPNFELSSVGSIKDCGMDLFDFDSFYLDPSDASSTPSLEMSIELSPEEPGQEEALVSFERGEV